MASPRVPIRKQLGARDDYFQSTLEKESVIDHRSAHITLFILASVGEIIDSSSQILRYF
jgi:hypothetical protein